MNRKLVLAGLFGAGTQIAVAYLLGQVNDRTYAADHKRAGG